VSQEKYYLEEVPSEIRNVFPQGELTILDNVSNYTTLTNNSEMPEIIKTRQLEYYFGKDNKIFYRLEPLSYTLRYERPLSFFCHTESRYIWEGGEEIAMVETINGYITQVLEKELYFTEILGEDNVSITVNSYTIDVSGVINSVFNILGVSGEILDDPSGNIENKISEISIADIRNAMVSKSGYEKNIRGIMSNGKVIITIEGGNIDNITIPPQNLELGILYLFY